MVILILSSSPLINLIFKLFLINSVASSEIKLLLLYDNLYSVLKSKHWGVWVNIKFSLFKFTILEPSLYFTEWSVLI